MMKCPSFVGAVLGAALVISAGAEDKKSAFGFTGPEAFPIDPQISLLHAADLDGDGLTDLVVVNNARSKINILYNQTGTTNIDKPAPGLKKDINELPPDARFHIDSIASEKRIYSMVVADLNGDGKPDIAYYGEPKELVVIYNQGNRTWSAPKRWPIEDGQLTANALATGRLNGDTRAGLVLLGENTVYYLSQTADHTLDEPRKIPYSGSVKAVQVMDINGDGRDDLLLVNWDSPTPFRFRLQNSDGDLGPEIYFTLPPIRAYLADDLMGDHKMEIVTVAQNSGRAAISDFELKPAEAFAGSFKEGQFQVLPLDKSAQPRRGVAWADINGDGLADLLVADPDSGQLTVQLQKTNGALAAPKRFPSLTGVTEIAVADWQGTGTNQIFLLSSDEHHIGVTQWDATGRIPFPTILPIQGRPLVMAVGPLQQGAKPSLAVITDNETNRSLVIMTSDHKTRSQKLAESFTANPRSMTMHDANQDGLMDLVVLIPYEKMKFLVQKPSHTNFDEADVAPPGGSIADPWLGAADVDGDGRAELLLAQTNFVRAVVLTNQPASGTNDKPEWTLAVKEQINGVSQDSRITGAAALADGTNAVPALFLLDAEKKSLTLCGRDAAGVWQVKRNLTLPVTDFTALQAVGLGGAKANCVALIGGNAVATLALDGPVWQMTELDSYETPIKDGHLADVVAGDLNNDGRKDVVFLETAKNYLDLVAFEAPHKLVPANRWQVFEERTFRSRRNDALEPREAVIADVTGDKKNDLIILVHDRVIVYPQE